MARREMSVVAAGAFSQRQIAELAALVAPGISLPALGTGAPNSSSPQVGAEVARQAGDRKEHWDAVSASRDRFRKRNRHYHNELERFFRFAIPEGSRVLEVGCSTGDLLVSIRPALGVGIDISERAIEIARAKHPHLTFVAADVEALPEDFLERYRGTFDYIVLADTLGELTDIWAALRSLSRLAHPATRILISYYNRLWEPILRLGESLGIKTPQRLLSWLSRDDISGLLHLTGFEVVRSGMRLLLPRNIPLLAWVANRLLATLPGLRGLCLVQYVVARPAFPADLGEAPSVSVIVPTRNEVGNIQGLVERVPALGRRTEIVFVDGSSTDGTVEKIEEMIAAYRGVKEIRLVHQVPRRRTEEEAVRDGLVSAPGKMLKLGKGDAVRKGFDAAAGEILMILDADLTVPPEDLPKFMEALVERRGELINGTRLVYPMEKEAMRLLNFMANKGFSLLFTWLLDQRIKDTLCGTKALRKSDYERIKAGRGVFGDFDPFGDFDLLFGAARLGLKIVEIPIRYRERISGEVKIQRFKHGILLLRMSVQAFRKLKMI